MSLTPVPQRGTNNLRLRVMQEANLLSVEGYSQETIDDVIRLALFFGTQALPSKEKPRLIVLDSELPPVLPIIIKQ